MLRQRLLGNPSPSSSGNARGGDAGADNKKDENNLKDHRHPPHPNQDEGAEDEEEQLNHHQHNSSGITTPHSLLTRDPQELLQLLHPTASSGGRSNGSSSKARSRSSTKRKQGMSHIVQLRCQVAMSLLESTPLHQALSKKRKRAGAFRLGNSSQEQGASTSSSQGSSSSSNPTKNNGYDFSSTNNRIDGTGKFSILPGVSRSALELVEELEETQRRSVVVTGCQALDQLLSFPLLQDPSSSTPPSYAPNSSKHRHFIPLGTVLHLSGPSATGKSQLALQMAAQVASAGHRSIVLTSTPATACRRLQPWLPADLLSNVYFPNTASVSTPTLRKTNKRQKKFRPSSKIPLAVTLGRLEQDVFLEQQVSNVQLLVIDDLVSHQDPHELDYISQWCRRISRFYPIVVLLVTPASSTSSWSMIHSDVHLSLTPSASSSYNAVGNYPLLDSHNLPSGLFKEHNVQVTATLLHHIEKVVPEATTTPASTATVSSCSGGPFSIPLEVTAFGLATPVSHTSVGNMDVDVDEPLYD